MAVVLFLLCGLLTGLAGGAIRITLTAALVFLAAAVISFAQAEPGWSGLLVFASALGLFNAGLIAALALRLFVSEKLLARLMS